MKILHIDSSISGDNSITRELTAAVVANIVVADPSTEITYRDLVADPVAHLDGAIAAGFRPLGISTFDDATQREHEISDQLVTEFLGSDTVIIGAPMYNFSVSTQLKAWLDRIAQPGKTFKYTATGPVGLAGGKRVIVVSARGGFYIEGPMARLDFQESYLKGFFGFLGIDDVRFVRVEGVSRGEEIRQKGITAARAAITDVLADIRAVA
ncbi:FMN-dependent NADH-azoreductase [Rhizobium sp. NBRC 114257]|uniref:FMN dependent NADH:quinone oxidoreductase n=1 Tax=Rhizobium dioscoreae TaxID=2653122 RepID=A0ABQ0ZDP2_9HYPH|nr:MULTISPECIES: FMN-dependent NADH-azoreductase [Rhizobium]GES53628.1 FMN-dependent NADH-azoreductase [Rhizobium dioscoreae]GLU85069.1 FMN-dependent NADH-azoreductase [Rhizobium sp. NBRC 114257]